MENTIEAGTPWNPLKKIAFRFFFIFFLLIIIIQNNGAFPGWDLLMKYPTELLHQFIPWVGKHVLGLSEAITVFTNGSGDTTYDYVLVFTIFVVSVLGTVIWSVLDSRKMEYDRLYYWLTVAVRFYVGLMLFNYGLVKVIKLQFPYPGFSRLTQPLGEFSPMGLAWTFLGFSKGYNLFMGVAEMAALLLLFRRTMTFGAIITLMTAANVMAVNYFYDVPVKLLSTTLVVMTLFLLARDAERLYRFFIRGELVRLPVIPAPTFDRRWLRITKPVLKYLVIVGTVITGAIQVNGYTKQFGENAPKPKLYGLYMVENYIVNNDTVPALKTDTLQWTQLQIEREGFARVRYMNDRLVGFSTQLDTTEKRFDFTVPRDTVPKFSLRFDDSDPNRLLLNGIIDQDTVSIVMKRKTKSDFLLINRGFNWISEYPFNR